MLSVHQTRSDPCSVPLVFIHGWGSSSAIWQSVCERLPGEHWQVDLPGFGAAEAQCLTLDELLAALAERLPARAVLVGWSLGGMLATRYAARWPERVAGLVTLASNPCFVARNDWPEAMPQATFDAFENAFTLDPMATWTRFCALQAQGDQQRKAVTQTLRALTAPAGEVVPAWQQGLKWLAQLDNRAALQQFTLPSLHIFGDGDALVHLAASTRVAGFDHAEIAILRQTGHALPVSRPEAVAQLIEDYCRLRQLPAKHRIASAFGRAASGYDSAARVQLDCAKALVAMADLPRQRVLDLGCGTGFVAEWLIARTGAQLPVVQLDLALEMVLAARRKQPLGLATVGDAEYLPFAGEQFGLVISNFVFQWCAEPARVLAEAMRVLQPGGQLLFTTLGPRSLHELKTAWAVIDGYVHVNHFAGSERWRTALECAGFEIETFDGHEHLAYYDRLISLLKDLKTIGAHNMNAGRNPGLTSPARLQALAAAYEQFRTADGYLPATYDVHFVLARKPL